MRGGKGRVHDRQRVRVYAWEDAVVATSDTSVVPFASAQGDGRRDLVGAGPPLPAQSGAAFATVAPTAGGAGGGWVRGAARLAAADGARAADRFGDAVSIVELVDAFVVALDAALSEHTVRADLSRWGEWLVMAATLARLRSRLLLPPEAPEARAAQDEAEAMRRQLLERAAVRRAAEWLDQQLQLGRDVFARGGVVARTNQGRTGDITDLFRAYLVALRVPEQVDAYQLRFSTLWRVRDAIARITRMLEARPESGTLVKLSAAGG